jgi:hypothetical protein
LRSWDFERELSVVTTKIVTVKPWLVTRRLPSSRTGIRCPMPGLDNKAA